MKKLTSISAIALCLVLSACDSMPRLSHSEIGAIGGAVAGGLAGSALTHGSTLGTVVGAGVGGAAGHEIGKRY
jgi:osmotically inducible lipoprotein OsmB